MIPFRPMSFRERIESVAWTKCGYTALYMEGKLWADCENNGTSLEKQRPLPPVHAWTRREALYYKEWAINSINKLLALHKNPDYGYGEQLYLIFIIYLSFWNNLWLYVHFPVLMTTGKPRLSFFQHHNDSDVREAMSLFSIQVYDVIASCLPLP